MHNLMMVIVTVIGTKLLTEELITEITALTLPLITLH